MTTITQGRDIPASSSDPTPGDPTLKTVMDSMTASRYAVSGVNAAGVPSLVGGQVVSGATQGVGTPPVVFASNPIIVTRSYSVYTVGMANAGNTGVGALLAFSLDVFGRVVGTRPPTTDDLPQGSKNLYANSVTATASVALTYPQIVAIVGGIAHPADPTNATDMASCLMVTTQAAASGASVVCATSTVMTEPAWSWAPGRIYLSAASGGLTQTLPISGAILEVGRAVSPTTIEFDVQQAILR